VIFSPAVAVRLCVVSFVDHRQIRHAAEVQAESLYEAAVVAIKLFREDPWLEKIGPSTVLDFSRSNDGLPERPPTRTKPARKQNSR
jgi:hypothetical protein